MDSAVFDVKQLFCHLAGDNNIEIKVVCVCVFVKKDRSYEYVIITHHSDIHVQRRQKYTYFINLNASIFAALTHNKSVRVFAEWQTHIKPAPNTTQSHPTLKCSRLLLLHVTFSEWSIIVKTIFSNCDTTWLVDLARDTNRQTSNANELASNGMWTYMTCKGRPALACTSHALYLRWIYFHLFLLLIYTRLFVLLEYNV